MSTVGLKESSFPLKYLGVPIVSSRLTKIECNELVEKITARIQTWSTRHISYAGRLVLINTVLFGIFNYWASIFLLPHEVTEKLTKLSRNYLWYGSVEFRHPPYVSWKQSCQTKAKGGLGIKDFDTWNKATIARLVWDIAEKKDILWVRWVHGRYLKGKDWWDYQPPTDSSWYWKKLCRIKEIFKQDPRNITPGRWQVGFTVAKGYQWKMQGTERVKWDKIVWARMCIPRHSFITWVLINHRLPTKRRLAKFTHLEDQNCSLCHRELEDEQHLFLSCVYATEIWKAMQKWWEFPMVADTIENTVSRLQKLKGDRQTQQITYAIFSAVIYQIWTARNHAQHKDQIIPVKGAIKHIKEQIFQTVFFIHSITQKYSTHFEGEPWSNGKVVFV